MIDHNALQQIRRSAVDLEPFTATWGVTNVWIVYNTFKWIRLDTIAAKAQGDVSQIVIAYNKLTSEPLSIRNTPDAVVIPPRHDWYVIGNVSDTMFGSPHGVYWITYTRNVTVKTTTSRSRPAAGESRCNPPGRRTSRSPGTSSRRSEREASGLARRRVPRN